MRRVSYFPYITLVIFLFSLMSLPKSFSERLRAASITKVASTKKIKTSQSQVDNHRLALENELLRNQANGFYEWLFFQQRLDEHVDRLKEYSKENNKDHYWKEFSIRRSDEIKSIIEKELQAIPAQIVFREPASWSSSVWINIGEKNNASLGRLIVGKNSPVVLGSSLVGVVEYVGESNSRIRLITDSGLVPSVRVVRGTSQDKLLLESIASLMDQICSRENLFSSNLEKNQILNSLSNLKMKLAYPNEDKYLAKGELYGASQPLWRSKNQILKGVGFNYCYSDEEGPSRDLKSGMIIGKNEKQDPLIVQGDLLVTTGLDGIFPPGLGVAIVSKVKQLSDGDCYYEIEAKPTARNLNDLSMVLVMPPLGFEEE